MTQEQIMRRMLEGFINDPADSPYQEGFLDAVCVIAAEVMGFGWDDGLIQRAQIMDSTNPQVLATAAKVKPALTLIDGGKHLEQRLSTEGSSGSEERE